MRILIADNKVCDVLNSQTLAILAKFGSVDIVGSGHDAVRAYLNSSSKGEFYDMIILDQTVTVQEGFSTVDAVRNFELNQNKPGERTMVCVISVDAKFQHKYQVRYDSDDRTIILYKPDTLDILEYLATSVVDGDFLETPSFPVPAHLVQTKGIQPSKNC